MSDVEHPNPGQWWQNRRRMAWVSLFGIVGIGGAAVAGIVPDGSIPLAQTVCWVFAAIVAVYSGGATVVDAVARLKGA